MLKRKSSSQFYQKNPTESSIESSAIMSVQLNDGFRTQNLNLVLEDLLVRFILNVPAEDLSSIERVFFQVEEAHWFYLDYVRQLNRSLPAMKMKSFAPRLLALCPLIWKWGDPADAISQFGLYKSTIPVRGVALLNSDMTKILLIQEFKSKTWSFPRGKISKGETDMECAIRECFEETGIDLTQYIDSEESFIERTMGGKNYKIYLARNIPESFDFSPKTQHEVRDIKWYSIKLLSKSVKQNPNHYFVVNTMIKPLISWINKKNGVTNEQELMLNAELKLKALLGIHQTQSLVAHNDAGRELLTILQGVKPVSPSSSNDNSNAFATQNFASVPMAPFQQIIQNSLPLQSQNFATNFGYPPPQLQHHFPNMSIYSSPPPNGLPHYTPPVMNPGPSETKMNNSKDILSILNGKPLDSSRETGSKEDVKKNRSKAQDLLSLINGNLDEEKESKPKIKILQRPKNSTPPVNQPPPTRKVIKPIPQPSQSNEPYQSENQPYKAAASNELEQTLNEAKPPTPGKITLLKRPNKASNELLGLLQKPQSGKDDNNEIIDPKRKPSSNDLLDMLKSPKNNGAESLNGLHFPNNILETTPKPANTRANELLDLLKKPESTRSDSTIATSGTPANQLLSLLHKSADNSRVDLLASPSSEPRSKNVTNLLNLLRKSDPEPSLGSHQESPEFLESFTSPDADIGSPASTNFTSADEVVTRNDDQTLQEPLYEDFDDLYDYDNAGRQPRNNENQLFDIASEDDNNYYDDDEEDGDEDGDENDEEDFNSIKKNVNDAFNPQHVGIDNNASKDLLGLLHNDGKSFAQAKNPNLAQVVSPVPDHVASNHILGLLRNDSNSDSQSITSQLKTQDPLKSANANELLNLLRGGKNW